MGQVGASYPAAPLKADVSVFVPSYNHAEFIASCLRSIFAQSCQPNLLLVIDDGSSDDSPRIVDSVLAECPFPCELIVREHRGLGATLNEALARSSGSLVTYLASDDSWESDRLRDAVNMMGAHPQAVATFGDCFLIDERGSILNVAVFSSLEGHRRAPWSRAEGSEPKVDLDGLLRFRSIPLTPTVTYRRDAVERFGWNESSRTEDYEMYMLLASIGDFAYVGRPLGSWRLHARNTSKDLEVMLDTALAVQRRVAERFGISNTALRHYQSCARYSYGEYFLRAGAWRRGTALTVGNLAGAPDSASALFERGARILVSPGLLRSLKSRARSVS